MILHDAEEQTGWRIIQHISHPHHIKRFAILGTNTDWPVISANSYFQPFSVWKRALG